MLVVGEGKQAIEYAVTGGVQLLTPLLSQGKCTLIIVKRNLRILVSDADAAELRAWCGSLAAGRRRRAACGANAAAEAGARAYVAVERQPADAARREEEGARPRHRLARLVRRRRAALARRGGRAHG